VPGEQLALFNAAPHPVVERLRAINPDTTTPLQALEMLADLVREAHDRSG